MKQKGLAKESDRTDWLNTHTKFIEQAKKGRYNIKSSSDGMLSTYYEGDPDALMGLEDGKAYTGTNFKNDNRRMSYLIKHAGDALVKDYSAESLAAKQKADKEKKESDDRLKGERSENLNRLTRGLGHTLYEKDYDTNADLVLKNYWETGDDKSRIARIAQAYGSKFKDLYTDNLYDADEFKSKFGVSLDEMRERGKQYYDPETGTFKGKYNKYADFMNLSNVFNTMGADDPFLNRVKSGNGGNETDKQSLEKLNKSEYFKDKAGRAFRDKDGKNPLNGLVEGVLYNNGLS